MARYGANELFNPGGRRRRKTGQASVTTGSQSGSLGPMPHSQAPDALGMLTSALSLASDIKQGLGEKDEIQPQEKADQQKKPDPYHQEAGVGGKPEDKASFIKRLGKKPRRIKNY